MKYYLKTIDVFCRAMKLRVRTSPPRTWAVFWRVWTDEQLLQRQLQMRLTPNTINTASRNSDWVPPTAPEGLV